MVLKILHCCPKSWGRWSNLICVYLLKPTTVGCLVSNIQHLEKNRKNDLIFLLTRLQKPPFSGSPSSTWQISFFQQEPFFGTCLSLFLTVFVPVRDILFELRLPPPPWKLTAPSWKLMLGRRSSSVWGQKKVIFAGCFSSAVRFREGSCFFFGVLALFINHLM